MNKFEDPYNCGKCRTEGDLCDLHKKIVADKEGISLENEATKDPDCGYCRRRGEPCKRHGGGDSQPNQKPSKTDSYARQDAHEESKQGNESAEATEPNVKSESTHMPDGRTKLTISTRSVVIEITELES